MRKSALYALGLVAASLVALGLVVLCSASQPNAVRLHHGNAFAFFVRQLVFAFVGIVAAFFVAKTDYRLWKSHRALSWILYGIVFLLLFAVFPPIGRCINGSYRWIPIGPINLQPSELAKLTIVIVVAMWMDRLGWKAERFVPGVVIPSFLIAGFAGPILAETDLGSAVVVGCAGFLMMLLGGTRWLYILGSFALGGCAVLGVLITNANRMRRLAPWLRDHLPSFLIGWLGIEQTAPAAVKKLSEMDSAAYQAYNSLVAIKNGGLWGVGLGQSMQKQYYLPEAHTDFVLAVGAEELGLIFTGGVILLFFAFFGLAVYIGLKASDRFGRYLAFGMGFIIFFQAMFNLGVVCEAFPTKGMALPFFSYGGTNLVSTFFAVGTIFSVGIHSCVDRKKHLPHKVLLKT